MDQPGTAWPMRFKRFMASLQSHQIEGKGIVWLGLPVSMVRCDNPYIKPGASGVLIICEQGTDLRIIKAVFHQFNDDGTLGPPVGADHPEFVHCAGLV